MLSKSEQNTIIAHEIGHIILHFSKIKSSWYYDSICMENIEEEANIFASLLLINLNIL